MASKTKGFKRNKLVWMLVILFAALAIFAYMILYTGGIAPRKTTTTEVMNKLTDIRGKGGEFQLTQKNIDELTTLYFAKPKSKGSITVTGVNVDILEDKILIKASISYKKLKLLFASQGKLSVSHEKVIYDADNFKIGKLTLPKKMVISQISKLNTEKVTAENTLIKFNSNLLPFNISSLEIKDNIIWGMGLKQDIKISIEDLNKISEEEIDKHLDILKQEIARAAILMNEAEKIKAKKIQDIIEKANGKSIEEKKAAISDSIDKINEVIDKTSDSKQKKELEKIKLEAEKAKAAAVEKEKALHEQTQIRRAALSKAQQDLGGAYSQVQTSKEKQIISIMQASMGKLAADASYNSSADQASVKSLYSTLDADSRNKFKMALFTNVDMDNASLLREIFGM